MKIQNLKKILSEIKIIIFVLITIAGIFILSISLYPDDFSDWKKSMINYIQEDSYKIYKEVCYNKTLSSLQEIKCFGDDGWELIGNRYTGKYSMNSSIALWAYKNNITNFKVQIQTGDYECVMGDLECVHKSNATINVCAYGDIIINNEVCEDKEVKEINIKLLDVPSYEYCKLIGFETLGVPSPKGDKFGCIKIIENKDLTKKWLSENCACSDECAYVNYTKDCFDNCKEYKCGDYKVVRQ